MSDSAGPSLGAQILIIIVLTLINAFFTASEMAIVSLDKNKLNALAEEKDKKALAILKLLKEPRTKTPPPPPIRPPTSRTPAPERRSDRG